MTTIAHNESSIRILHVLNDSVPAIAGYSTRSRMILEHQLQMGWNPVAITSLRQPGSSHAWSDYRTPPSETHYGIRYYRCLSSPSLQRARRLSVPLTNELMEMLLFRRSIYAVARSLSPGLIHAHSPILVGYPALRVARSLGVPFVYEIRAFWEDAAENQGKQTGKSVRYRTTRKLETALVNAADSVVVICEGLRKDLLKRGIPSEKVFVVPNGVSTDTFVPMPRDTALQAELGLSGKKIIGYIGTFYRFEGLRYLVEAMGMLRQEADVACVIAGYGEAEAEIKNLIQEHGLEKVVRLIGKVEGDRVRSLYSIVDIFVYPRTSSRITELVTPLKPLEAMSMAKAVVASDVGGLRELIRNEEDGLLFQPENARDLAKKLFRLATEPELTIALGTKARQAMVSRRKWGDIVERYRDVYACASEMAQRRKPFHGSTGA